MVRTENDRLQTIEREIPQLRGLADHISSDLTGLRADLNGLRSDISVVKAAVPQISKLWNVAAVIAAILSCLAAIFSALWPVYQASKNKSSYQGQITRLQSDLQLLTLAVAPQLLERVGPVVTSALRLPDAEATRVLNNTSRQIQLLSDTKAPVNQSTLKDSSAAIAALLQARPNLQGTQNLAANFVTYSSAARYLFAPVRDLPNCLDPAVVDVDHFETTASGSSIVFALHDCRLILDDQARLRGYLGYALHHSFNLDSGSPLRIGFHITNGIIEYRGGPIAPVSQVQAEHCRFVFATNPDRVPVSQQLLLTALASQTDTMSFSS